MNTIDRAFDAANRSIFLGDDVKGKAAMDVPLPIGYGQANSQPSTVRQMLGWLDAHEGDKVLDVGYGSGWTTALLSYIVGPKGMVYAAEKITELAELGAKNCTRANIKNAHYFEADGMFGLPEYAPYDRILVSAASPAVPPWLLSQLKSGGKLVIPIQNDIQEITKISDSELHTVKHPGFVFVPLI